MSGSFKAEQEYHQQKRLRHNRYLHGFGVVCGLLVTPTDPPEPGRVVVEPGLALDCLGREIVLPEPVDLEVSACAGEEKLSERDLPGRVCVTLKYDENETAWVALPGGTEKEPSRIEEGYRLSVGPDPAAMPESKDDLSEEIAEVLKGDRDPQALRRLLVELLSPPCPSVPEACALTLAAIDLGPGPVLGGEIDNVSCRRLVLCSERVLEVLWQASLNGSPSVPRVR